MGDLILYVILAVVGYFLAGKLRKYEDKIRGIPKFQTVAIVILVFAMGSRMGSNDEIVSNLNKIGIYALIFTVITIIFSMVAVTITRKIMKLDKFGDSQRLDDKHVVASVEADIAPVEESTNSGKIMTMIILVTVTLGLFFGYLFVDNIFPDYAVFNSLAGNTIKIGLCLLLFLIGFEMGLEGTFIQNFKKAGIKVIIFPIVIGLGTLLAALVCSIFIPISVRESLAIGAGFGWYSLAPVIIMEKGFITASAISFMHNILRELLGLLFIPIVAQKIGYLESIAIPGSAASDVCLPIIAKSTKSEIAIYSFISGVTLSALVPILVPIMIG